MKPYYEHAGITIYHADCREILPGLTPVDLIFTSPPYNLGNTTGGGGTLIYDEKAGNNETPKTMTDAEILHIFFEILLGRGNHGSFLRAYALAVQTADDENFPLLRWTSLQFIDKYELEIYLDNFQEAR